MLTLHHFTNPLWFTEMGGWTNFKSAKYFERYTKFIAENLGQYVDFWITINEPGIYANMSYMEGYWPPQEKNPKKLALVYLNMGRAHRRAYKTLHKVLDQGNKKTMVGIAQNTISFTSYEKHNLLELLYIHFADRLVNHFFFDITKKHHDFLGVNFYYRVRLKQKEGSLLPEIMNVKNSEKEVSDMGTLIYPHGLFSVLMDFKDFNLPIYVTENGVAAEDDKQRERFIVDHVKEIHRAIANGVDVRGYFYWSLLDNFEWDKSFGPKFGLVAVDRRTFKRTPKGSYNVYKKICEDNGIVQ
jgi:beta-glucosidase